MIAATDRTTDSAATCARAGGFCEKKVVIAAEGDSERRGAGDGLFALFIERSIRFRVSFNFGAEIYFSRQIGALSAKKGVSMACMHTSYLPSFPRFPLAALPIRRFSETRDK